MKGIIVVLALLCLAELGVIGLLMKLCEDEKEARLRAIREGYPWDWTRESEKRARSALELVCDKCHEPFRCSQDELDAACAMCPVPDAVWRLAAGKEARG